MFIWQVWTNMTVTEKCIGATKVYETPCTRSNVTYLSLIFDMTRCKYEESRQYLKQDMFFCQLIKWRWQKRLCFCKGSKDWIEIQVKSEKRQALVEVVWRGRGKTGALYLCYITYGLTIRSNLGKKQYIL